MGGVRLMFASLLNFIANLSKSGASTACFLWILDEPEMPKHMIEK